MFTSEFFYYVLWAVLFFTMMRIGCGAHIMGHARKSATPARDVIALDLRPAGIAFSAGASGVSSRAIDPTCHMSVETATARSAARHGLAYYFCSQKCRDAFESLPAEDATAGIVLPSEQEKSHGCC